MKSSKKKAKSKVTAKLHFEPMPAPKNGKIITFYSYKGGTGRSLAVAHVAWILADSGQRVLVIDWDLEAPGLHRYFHPFLDDQHLADTCGLMDFFAAFVEGSRIEHAKPSNASWFERYANFFPYALSLRGYEFGSGGGLDFMPAGRQDGGYAVRVARFDWEAFYDELGGGVFLQAFKRILREHYDYILIDSRTGISDTSGICTVQMPDELVLCFTYNSQSILGAEAAARSVQAQRLRPSGKSGLLIWPVPTRVELNEQNRLDAARVLAQETFKHLLTTQRTVKERQDYWNRIEMPYTPYLAFEEILAPFVDRSRSKLSILDSFAALTSKLTGGLVKSWPTIIESIRQKYLKEFERAASAPASPDQRGSVYLSFAIEDSAAAANIGTALNKILGDEVVFRNSQLVKPGDDWVEVLNLALKRARAVLILVSPQWMKKSIKNHSKQEAIRAFTLKKRMIPVLMDTHFSDLNSLRNPLKELSRRQGYLVSSEDTMFSANEHMVLLASQLKQLLIDTPETCPVPVDEDDPQKGQWGGQSMVNGRELRAKVSPTDDDDWFDINLEVVSHNDTPLKGPVVFHLHDTFIPDIRTVAPDGSRAFLLIQSYGAFTAGAEADGGRTRLELDLAKLPGAPKVFREN